MWFGGVFLWVWLKPIILIPYESMIDDRNHFGSAWSLPQRRAGVLSSPAVAGGFWAELRTPQLRWKLWHPSAC